jgi:dihydrodipicolinate synthase/N-acetylneuraminate lyase
MRYTKSEARAWVRANLKGYMTVLYTPFGPDGDIDEAALRRNVERTLTLPGVGGLSVNSIHQEFWTLTPTERMRLVDIVLETVAGRVPVVIGCSDPAARNVVAYARHAERAGADLVMVWPPYYGPRTEEGVRTFYEEVAARIDIGLIVYSTTLAELGFYLTPPMVEALLGIEHLVAVQDTSLSFSSFAGMVERVGDRIAVSTSLEETFLFGRIAFGTPMPDFLIGSSRPVFAQNATHPHCGRFIAAALAGDHQEAARHMRRLVEIAQKLQGRYFARGFHHVSLFKALAGAMGMETGRVRAPQGRPDPRELAECLEVLRGEGLLPA